MVISSRRIEYEYAFTNGELDIDKIVNKRKRENLISAIAGNSKFSPKQIPTR